MLKRLHSIDAARAFFLLLGIPYHFATLTTYKFKIHSDELLLSPVVAVFTSVSHSFRMFGFFVLSGYFSALLIQRRNKREWFHDRLNRLGVPLIVSFATIGIAVNVAERIVTGEGIRTASDIAPSLGHLWFLVVLLLYVSILYATVDRITISGTSFVRAFSLQGWQGAVFMALLMLWGLGRSMLDVALHRVDIPASSVLSHFLLHAPAFAIGVIAQFSTLKERLFSAARRWHFLAAAALTLVSVYLDTLARPALGLADTKTLVEKVVSNCLELPLAYIISICTFKIMGWIVKDANPVIKFFVDGAMAIYLFHIFWVMVVIFALRNLEMAAELRWAVGSLIVGCLSAGTYLVIRRNSWLSAAYCGTRMPWFGRRTVLD